MADLGLLAGDAVLAARATIFGQRDEHALDSPAVGSREQILHETVRLGGLPLDERELQQIEAWHWQEPFGEVYRSDLSR